MLKKGSRFFTVPSTPPQSDADDTAVPVDNICCRDAAYPEWTAQFINGVQKCRKGQLMIFEVLFYDKGRLVHIDCNHGKIFIFEMRI